MDLTLKLAILADAAKYDASCASSGAKRKGNGKLGNATGVGICHSYTPDGRCVSLLKILLTNFCIYDCVYCVNRISSNTRRARFTPEEVASLTINFYKRNYIEGLFLSSGIIQSPDYTMEQLVRCAQLLRLEHQFNGYIHLKAVPGASSALLELAGRYADRLSANIELPTAADLRQLAPQKDHAEITAAMGQIAERIEVRRGRASSIHDAEKTLSAETGETYQSGRRAKEVFAPAGQSTQMIVGATPASDMTILRTADGLYRQYALRRVYYSAFSPIPHHDSRLPGIVPPLLREHRLYQADWLLRFYGFTVAEISTAAVSDCLSLNMDPKLAWALHHRGRFPVDINRAPRHELLRVPGLGVRNVDRIIRMRRIRSVRLEDLVQLRVPIRRARPFVIAGDFHPSALKLDQLSFADVSRELPLFAHLTTPVGGEK